MSTATPDAPTPQPATSKVRKFKHDFAPANNVPALPTEVERGLLQVGMRVRAAMSQGYRTYHDRNAGLLHSNLEPITGSANWQDPFGRNLEDLRGSNDAAAAVAGQRSLVSTQTSTSTDASAKEPVSSPGRKRALDLAEDESAGATVPKPEDSMDAATTQLRSIAQPKSRKRTFGRVQTAPARFESEPDFDEADFLVPENWSGSKAVDGTGL